MRNRSLASIFKLFVVTTLVASGIAYSDQKATAIVTPVSFLLAGSNTVAEASFREVLSNGNAMPDDFAMALAGLAYYAVKGGDLDSATSFYRRAFQIATPTNELRGLYLTMAADALHRASKYHEAAATYSEASALSFPQSANARFMAADSFERAGNIKRAEELYTEVALLNSEALSADALLRLAALYERSNRYTDAESTYNTLQWAKRNKDMPPDLYNRTLAGLIRTHIQHKNYSSALKVLKNIKSDPTGEFTFFKLLPLSGLDKRDEAKKLADAFITANLTNNTAKCTFLPEILFWDAADDYLAGDFRKSRETFLLITERYPNNRVAPWAFLLVGVSSFQATEYKQSVEDFANFIRSYPNSILIPDARFYQAKALANLARFEDAVLILDDLIERFHDNKFVVEATILRGDCLFASCAAVNNFRQAANSYAAALAKIDISDSLKIRASIGLARSLYESDDHFTAQKVLTQLAKTHPAEADKARIKIFGNNSEAARSK